MIPKEVKKNSAVLEGDTGKSTGSSERLKGKPTGMSRHTPWGGGRFEDAGEKKEGTTQSLSKTDPHECRRLQRARIKCNSG